MFERARPVAVAMALGYVLAGFLVALAVGMAYGRWNKDPFQQVPNWEQVLEQHARQAATFAFAYLLIFGLAVVALFFWLGVAGRARRGRHPTSATLGALFTSASLLALAGAAIWNGIVAPYAALLYGWTRDETFQQALFGQFITADFVFKFGVWCLILFGAVGLYFLGRALRRERGWLPDVLKLAAALALLHVPMTLYLARESLRNNHYVRWVAVVNELLLWGGLAAATYFAAAYLRREARNLYATRHLSKN
ncbi:MAG: hypothetical protein ACE5MH_01985 [Terriglobia bacterium]